MQGRKRGRTIHMSADDFDRLMEQVNSAGMEEDGYIPSEDELLDHIEADTVKYYKYLLWYSEHKPKPETEEQKRILKRLTAAINRTIVIG